MRSMLGLMTPSGTSTRLPRRVPPVIRTATYL
jgi:hypothetical protein